MFGGFAEEPWHHAVQTVLQVRARSKMPRRQAAKEQLGEARCMVLRYPRAYLKILLMILPIAAVGLSLSYDKVAYIHQKNDTAWFNLTVKFPFAFDKNTATYTNETAPPGIEFEDDIEICSWLFLGANAVWLIMALAILLTYVSVHGGDRMESAATADGFISCTMALIGTTLTSLWLYNVITLRKAVIGSIDYVYNGPSQCTKNNMCDKSIPDFLFLYIAAGVGFLASLLWGISIIIALKYAFWVRKGGDRNITGILEMNNGRPDELHL